MSICLLKDLGNVFSNDQDKKEAASYVISLIVHPAGCYRAHWLPQEARSASCGFHGPVRAQHRPCPLISKVSQGQENDNESSQSEHERMEDTQKALAQLWNPVLQGWGQFIDSEFQKCLCLLPTWGGMSSLRKSRLPQCSCAVNFVSWRSNRQRVF